MSTLQTDRRVCLKLADGQTWVFTGTKDYYGLIERLATLMELPSCPQRRGKTMIFYQSDLTKEQLPEHFGERYGEFGYLPKRGWYQINMEHVRIWRHPQSSVSLCEVDKKNGKIIDVRRLLEVFYLVNIDAVTVGGAIAHSALLEYQGAGILIVATSGTGKSTCCRRVKDSWQAICDDEALILPTGNLYRVHPLPTWNDYLVRRSKKTWDVQRHLPLSALFFLRQSEDDYVEPTGKGMAAYSLYRSSLQVFNRYKPYLAESELNAANKQLFENACKISRAVPSYVLNASLRGRFWEGMEKVL